MDKKYIEEYANTLIKSEYNVFIDELMPIDAYLFTEKYINGKTNKDLKLSSRKSRELNNRLIKAIKLLKNNSIENISETHLRYKCRKINKNKEYADFCVDAFINKLSNKELSDKYFIDTRTVAVYKTNRKRELQSFWFSFDSFVGYKNS